MKTGTPEDNPFKKREKKAELKEFENAKEDFMDVVSKNMEKEYSNFENVVDPDLIDCSIYELKAVQMRYRFLLKQAELLEKAT